MIFAILGFLCVAVFLLCFLIDRLVSGLAKKRKDGEKKTVRMPKRSAVFGVILIVFAAAALLFRLPEGETALTVGCGVIALMGAVLIVHYGSFCIVYDDTGFAVKELFKKEKTFSYAQIEGQRSLMTRGGVNATLFVNGDTLMLTSAMQGAQAFLCHAFYKWCAEKGVDPDSVENNPRMMTYFPDK